MQRLNLQLCIAVLLCASGVQAQNLDHFDLMAHYSLVNTTEDALDAWDTIELVNAPLSDTNGVYSYGGYIYDDGNEDSSLVITPRIDAINAPQFAIQVELKMDQLEDKGRPIIIVGEDWRYLGFATGSDSSFQLILNGNYQSAEPYYAKAGVWQILTMMHSRGDSLTSFFVDGNLIYRRKGYLDHPASDTKIMNTHFGIGQAFKGYWRNLKVFTSDSTTSPTVEISKLKEMTFFPNPSRGSVTVELEDLTGIYNTLVIYDEIGRVVRTINDISSTVEVNGLPQGTLTAVLLQDNKQVAMHRIVVVPE